MLSMATTQLVEEVFTSFGGSERKKRDKEIVKADPEACLVAMLLVIKERLPNCWPTLRQTIEMAPAYLEEAKKKLEKNK